MEVQLELACKDEGLDLNRNISLAIKLDQHLRGKARRPPTLLQQSMHYRTRDSTKHQTTTAASQRTPRRSRCRWGSLDYWPKSANAEWTMGSAFIVEPLGISIPSAHSTKYHLFILTLTSFVLQPSYFV